MKIVLAITAIFALAIIMGCSQENHKDPASMTSKDYDFTVYIDISAEGEGEYVPFHGTCDLWAVSQPVANPPPSGDPTASVTWGQTTYDPTLIWETGGDAYYLYWYGYQIVRPPNGGWELETICYEGHVDADEDYYDVCVFQATK